MAALSFPNDPIDGQRFPANPGTDGSCQYEWNEAKGVWNVVSAAVRTNNQGAFNEYVWPNEAPEGEGYQLVGDSEGNLVWDPGSNPKLKSLALLESFDGIRETFTIVENGTATPFNPEPDTNLVIFLGGVPQIPGENASYVVYDDEINFSEPPAPGTVFYGFSIIKG